MDTTTPAEILRASEQLADAVDRLSFAAPVHTVYNPLRYAWTGWSTYVQRYANPRVSTLLVGMNPGPWGMAQIGVPFGEIAAVREWMGIEVPIDRPEPEHPKRPIEGFACTRSEVSGRRLWGLMRERFGSAESFFASHFVGNYCPLVFMADGGRNITPDKLPAAERSKLFAACDAHLRELIRILSPQFVIGVGRFAQQRIRACLDHDTHRTLPSPAPTVGTILHPSPASPAANRGWAQQATAQLIELGAWPRERS